MISAATRLLSSHVTLHVTLKCSKVASIPVSGNIPLKRKRRRNSLKSAIFYLTFLFTFCSGGNEQSIVAVERRANRCCSLGVGVSSSKAWAASTLPQHQPSVSRCHHTSSPGGLVLIGGVCRAADHRAHQCRRGAGAHPRPRPLHDSGCGSAADERQRHRHVREHALANPQPPHSVGVTPAFLTYQASKCKHRTPCVELIDHLGLFGCREGGAIYTS